MQQELETITLFNNVRQWGIDKGITGIGGKGNVFRQMDKVQEEVTETKSALNWHDNAKNDEERQRAKLEVIDGIGDSLVTLILLAEFIGVPAEECLESALTVIQQRTGTMIGGQFVKNA